MSKEARQDAERYIRERAKEYFSRDKSGKGYICPICGSGSGRGRYGNGTGITENPKSPGHFTCWGGGCFSNADIFEIIGKQHNLDIKTEFNEIFNKACEIFGVTVYDEYYRRQSSTGGQIATPSNGATQVITVANSDVNSQEVKTAIDYTEFYKQAAANIGMTDYYRGLGLDTLKSFNVGFMAEWRANEKAPTSPRLIIPINRNGYLARDTRANLTPTQERFKKMRVGKVSLFNAAALSQDKIPVFIVEGELDALSIVEAGGQAVALCGIANINKLIKAIQEQPPKCPLVIQLDNDDAGQKAATKLEQALKEAKFFLYRQYSLPGNFKDANEFLMSDRAKFTEWVKAGEKLDFEAVEQEVENQARENFEREAISYSLNNFIQAVLKNREGREIPTGFENLDKLLDGGLYAGLYVIGANSSLGKTTFALQIADNIAQAGHGVLIFSLEMATNELIAKTLSRLSLIKSLDGYKSTCYARTTRNVLLGRFYNEYDREIINQAIQEYSQWGENIHITEGIGNVGLKQITEKVKEWIKFEGKPPVVVIDYLQILAPYSEKMTDKQNVDRNITELKRLSRDFNIPVIGISSFNRENYSAPVSMASFKESGAIEYSSDVLIGMQYNGYDYQEGETDGARIKRLRSINKAMEQAARDCCSQDIQVKILKNRNGIKGSLLFDFFPSFNYFRGKIEG